MPQLTATTAPATIPALPGYRILIQNNGAGTLYFGTSPTVSAANGLQLAAGATYEQPIHPLNAKPLYVVSATTTDVRYDYI